MKFIDVGTLDRKITIQSVTATSDPLTNEPIKTFATLATPWAKRLKNQSNEQYDAAQQVSTQTVRYLIRWRSDVTEKMRIVDGAKTFEISGIEEMDRKVALILTAISKDNG